jgi:DNA-binding NarL/FixJ family response regulator
MRMATTARGDAAVAGSARKGPVAGRVLVVDDRRPAAESLARALSGPGVEVSVLVEPGLDGTVPSAAGGGVAVLDGGIGSPGDAEALARALDGEGWRVLVMAGGTDPLTVAAALEAGAAAHLPADAGLEETAEAVGRLRLGERAGASLAEREQLIAALRAHRRESARRRLPFERLTPRERHVLEGLVEGRRADEIAAASFVSVTTVRNQIQSVLTKLGAGSQIEAVAMARRAGWPS